MRRSLSWFAGMLLIAAAGFAVASITRGSSSAGAQTATVTTIAQPQTVTVTSTQTVTVTRTAKVTICHRTGKRRPFAKTITVPATKLFAHFRHGDLPGRCTAAKIRQMKKRR
jgi:hypothetical protein